MPEFKICKNKKGAIIQDLLQIGARVQYVSKISARLQDLPNQFIITGSSLDPGPPPSPTLPDAQVPPGIEAGDMGIRTTVHPA